jgi:hypothetical protein
MGSSAAPETARGGDDDAFRVLYRPPNRVKSGPTHRLS